MNGSGSAVRCRSAIHDDAIAIAGLHADSWRVSYRGAYRDDYLDGDVVQDRVEVWGRRLSTPPDNQFVVVAEEADRIVGFACAYGGEDATWGTLLDNIHVRPECQRHGVGTRLLSEVAAWCRDHYAEGGLYLWVLAQNRGAQQFYRRLGAADRGGEVFEPPGGGEVKSRRYAWTELGEIARARHASHDRGTA